MAGEGDAAVSQADAFAFEKAPLKAGERFSYRDTTAGGEHAMPGDRLASRASGHGAARGASPAAQTCGSRHLPIGHDAALGDALDQLVDSAPAFSHAQKDNRKADGLPVLPPYETQ